MPFFAIAPESDDRASRGVARVRLENCQLEPAPKGAGYQTNWLIKPTPGRELVATMPGFVRGLFRAPGVQGAVPFVAAGQYLYSLSSTYAQTTIGAIAGADTVGFDEFRDDLVLRAGGQLKYWDGSTLQTVIDVDAPSSPGTIAQVGLRLISAETTGDAMGWSRAGLPLDWDAAGSAADFYLSDPIVAQWRQGGDLVSFNAASVQRWRPTGGSEAEAFEPILSATHDVGLLSRDSVARLGDNLCFVSHKGIPYRIGNAGPGPLPFNKGVEDAIAELTATQRARLYGWTYEEGSRQVYILRAPGLDRALCCDLLAGLWHDRKAYGESEYDLAFSCEGYDGETLVAGPGSAKVWRLSRSVFTDDGQPIIRRMTVIVPMGQDGSINSLGVQIQVTGQPLTGQGSSPVIMLRVSRDGGQTWDQYIDTADLAVAGIYQSRPTFWRLGRFLRQYGVVIELSISDPVDFTISGVWVNEGRP